MTVVTYTVSKQQTPTDEHSAVKQLQSKASTAHLQQQQHGGEHQQQQPHFRSERLGVSKLILFSLFPLAMTTSFAFSLAVLLPSQIIEIVGSQSKAYVLGILGATRGLASVLAGLAAGYISDHLATRFGKRMPIIMIGSIINAMFIFSRAFLEKPGRNMLILNGAALIFGDMAGQMSSTCYMSLFPDLFQPDQMGLLSGLNSFVSLLASALGVGVMGYLYQTYVNPIILISIVAGGMIMNAGILVFMFREPEWHYHPTVRWVDPHEWRNSIQNRTADEHEHELLKCETGNATAAIELQQQQQQQQQQQHQQQQQDVNDHNDEHASHNDDKNTLLSEIPIEPIPSKKSTGVRTHLKNIVVKSFGIVIDIISTFKSWSFVWLFITRCFFTLGLGVVQNFSLYFFEDKVGPIYKFFKNTTLVTSSQQAQAVFMICVLATGLISSISGGLISDKVGRRSVITLSSLLLSAGLICMGVFTWNYTILLACGVLIGLGVGAFLAADLGLANDIIDPSSSAKELATFQMAQTLPTVVSSPLSGLIVQLGELIHFKRIKAEHIGYNIILFFCAALSLATALGIWCVRVDCRSNSNTSSYDSSEEEDSSIPDVSIPDESCSGGEEEVHAED